MPVLKVNPTTGESLDKTKTPEEAAAIEAARVKALEEYKERVKTKKPRKKKVVEEEEVQVTPKILVVKKDIPAKVNPFEAPNGEINAEELLVPLNALLKAVEDKLKLITQGYKLTGVSTDAFTKLSLPKEFEYKSSVTRVKDGSEAFQLVKPSGITSLKYTDLNKDVYVDRIFLKPIDVRELLKSDKAFEILRAVVIDGMWKNLWETKELDPKKKYFGTEVARINLGGPLKDQYCVHNTTYDEAMIEIRMFSDITELPNG